MNQSKIRDARMWRRWEVAGALGSVKPLPLQLMRLRNGQTAPMATVLSTSILLEHLLENEPVLFCELVMICRDPNHVLFGDCGVTLQALAMIESVDEYGHARVHSSVRNIVVSAVTGEELGLALVSPLAP